MRKQRADANTELNLKDTMFTNSTVLILAPHTDDGEFGCGGTIAKLTASGETVYYAAFSVCEASVHPGFPKDILEVEVKGATAVLGIPPENLFIYRYPVRHHPEHRQAILDNMVELRDTVNPDVVFMPSGNDIHQDHTTVYNEGLRAFKQTTVLGYELPWNNVSFNTTAFVRLDESHIDSKVDALGVYQSQAHRHYANAAFIRSLAITRGTQIGVDYAEAFEVVRWVMG